MEDDDREASSCRDRTEHCMVSVFDPLRNEGTRLEILEEEDQPAGLWWGCLRWMGRLFVPPGGGSCWLPSLQGFNKVNAREVCS